jgi:hypothetical protein
MTCDKCSRRYVCGDALNIIEKMLKYIGEHPNINDDEIMNKVEEILGCPSYEKEKEMMKRFMPSSLDDSQ